MFELVRGCRHCPWMDDHTAIGAWNAQSGVLNPQTRGSVFVYYLLTISFRYFERGERRAVYCVKQFFQFCFAYGPPTHRFLVTALGSSSLVPVIGPTQIGSSSGGG